MKEFSKELQTRGAFLKNLGLSTSALMAFYCLGTTTMSCGSKDEDPLPGGSGGVNGGGITGTTTGSSINFTIDLSHSTQSALKTVGAFKIIGDVLVAHTTDDRYVALSKNCTHEGNTLAYRGSSNDLFCSNHGSEFTTAGAVKKGPDTGDTISSLRTFSTSLSGEALTVKS